MAVGSTGDPSNTGPLPIGSKLQGRYVIERLLGGGGMGVVYLARDGRLANRPCAVKEMVDHFIDPQQRRQASEYFAREADTLARLKHPAIPSIFDRFDDRNRHYLVMEYVEGRNLEEELAALGHPMPESTVIDIARQLCDVLSYLHDFKPPIVYRDMKPSNVMMTPSGRIILIDFGIARLFKGAGKGTMIGTLGFAPPEQYKGEVDPRADIYSLGATLHYVVTGRDPEKFPPFSFPPVHDLRPDVSKRLAGAIDRALAYKVEERPQTVHELRDMLLYGVGLETHAAPAVSPRSGTAELTKKRVQRRAAQPRPPKRRRWRRVVVLAAVTLTIGAGAFGATYVYHDPQLQAQLGIKPLIDNLPWKRAQLLARARADPLSLQTLSIRLTSREGYPLSVPKTSFLNTDFATSRYLGWTATVKNNLAGLEASSETLSARIYSPTGVEVASSEDSRFIGTNQSVVDLGGVALMPDLAAGPFGEYRIALYRGDQLLGEQNFSVQEDIEAKAKAQAEQAAARAAAEAEKKKQQAEEMRLAAIEQARRKPLTLQSLEFLNTTKTGTPLSGYSSTFNASKVLFVAWEAKFKNHLYNLDTGQYRVDAAYVAPDGRVLGSVSDYKVVPPNAKSIDFTGRIGNAAGGAFLPGTYTVNFYLDGKFLAEKKFQIIADTGPRGNFAIRGGGPTIPRGGGGGVVGGSGGGGNASARLDSPLVASGKIEGLAGTQEAPIEVRLRPQPNSFLRGELVIHYPGYGVTALSGFVRGEHIEFEVAYGSRILYFEGRKSNGTLSGVFQSQPSGTTGTWRADIN
jgi:serine/threonine protein kinase